MSAILYWYSWLHICDDLSIQECITNKLNYGVINQLPVTSSHSKSKQHTFLLSKEHWFHGVLPQMSEFSMLRVGISLTVSLYGISSKVRSFQSNFIFSSAFSKECSFAAAAPISSSLYEKKTKGLFNHHSKVESRKFMSGEIVFNSIQFNSSILHSLKSQGKCICHHFKLIKDRI